MKSIRAEDSKIINGNCKKVNKDCQNVNTHFKAKKEENAHFHPKFSWQRSSVVEQRTHNTLLPAVAIISYKIGCFGSA